MAWYDFLECFPCEFKSGSFYNKIHGTSVDDVLRGTASRDDLLRYGRNDGLAGNPDDRLDGGDGIDTAAYGDSTVGVTVNLATGHGYGGDAEGQVLVSIENVDGSDHNDTITGNDVNNYLQGLRGNDVIDGADGWDGVRGDDGDDILKGGGGADILEGGSGVDTADYSQAPPTDIGFFIILGVDVDLSANRAYWGDAQGDIFYDIENVTGS